MNLIISNILTFLFTNAHILTITIIIIIVGAFAGLTKFFLEKEKESTNNNLAKNIFQSIGASILVPLLLNMLSSSLIIYSNEYDKINYFVFAGFCFIAGFYSERFIYSIGQKILKDIEENKKEIKDVKKDIIVTDKNIETLISDELEGEKIDEDNLTTISKSIDDIELTKINGDFVKELIQSLNRKYKYRTIEGLRTELDRTRVSIYAALEGLEKFEIVKRVYLKDKNTYWTLTKKGKSYAKNK